MKKLAKVRSSETTVAASNALTVIHSFCHFSSRCKLNQLILLHYPDVMVLITGIWRVLGGITNHLSFANEYAHAHKHLCVHLCMYMCSCESQMRMHIYTPTHTQRSMHVCRLTSTLAETCTHYLPNKLVWPLNPIFLDKGAEKQQGASLMLLTAQESVMRRLIML